ncbi:ABC transporter ATP-binding protein [Nitratireductor aquimarinus]|uniref:ABC transporter ATP-binding protein n=1 Tax=Alphaproteobacteria TaxID=28211 RepID=UPI000DDE233E|nr:MULTISPECIES: ABC transporter ATP-binding protein [Alphaproteobacteria]MBY6020353.1 ABC transporter ATP-binding protein [Nitratireductor sp. DP7N14-4]MBN7755567.1 ABC transporter ATP-binding protein [Nitratireductor aquimarinus]MBN7763354.1 ABC transporter ATP-binding protein [Nitratireductor aquibiodomus]MBN8242354.1 ABC transporter ATP-binding protein [Nitratireductor aquimarinus]MBY5998322.1 ABC transporter ATP-binding protein [Tritonibacter mobilis]
MDTTLSIRRLTKQFDNTRALKGIDLEVPAGRFVTLLGPSGCGKTTLLRSIAGITDPTTGEIWLADKRIDALAPENRNFGMVFQTYALFPHMSVEKNVAFGLEMRNVAKPEIATRVAAALELVGLGQHARRLPRQLSGGQQQRVALARAIVIEPDVLLFDEPLSNLDAKLRDSLREDLRTMQRKLGTTSIYVTHDQSEAMALADEIVVMKDGEIVERGTPVDLYRRPRFRFTAEFLGLTNVIEADISGSECRLPWGAVRKIENPAERASEGIAIRPEDIGIDAASGEADGVVEQSMFLGASTHYWVSAAGQELRVITAGGQSDILATGQPVKLTPPPALHLLKTFEPVEAMA